MSAQRLWTWDRFYYMKFLNSPFFHGIQSLDLPQLIHQGRFSGGTFLPGSWKVHLPLSWCQDAQLGIGHIIWLICCIGLQCESVKKVYIGNWEPERLQISGPTCSASTWPPFPCVSFGSSNSFGMREEEVVSTLLSLQGFTWAYKSLQESFSCFLCKWEAVRQWESL